MLWRLQVAAVVWVLLLFRLLSTTAEVFFSPIMTQLAQDFYFPPRLAGGMSPTTSTLVRLFPGPWLGSGARLVFY